MEKLLQGALVLLDGNPGTLLFKHGSTGWIAIRHDQERPCFYPMAAIEKPSRSPRQLTKRLQNGGNFNA
jgi:hypothetical protein